MVVACWCQHWFEYFPNPPINVLSLVENVLAFHDKELLRHFVRHGVTSQVDDDDTFVHHSQHAFISFCVVTIAVVLWWFGLVVYLCSCSMLDSKLLLGWDG